jgi:hypothetical protein
MLSGRGVEVGLDVGRLVGSGVGAGVVDVGLEVGLDVGSAVGSAVDFGKGMSTLSMTWITQPLVVVMSATSTVASPLMTTSPLATVMLSFFPVRLVSTSIGRPEDVVIAEDLMASDVTRWYRKTLAS